MAVLNFKRKTPVAPVSDGTLTSFLTGFSIEVMPRTAAKIESFGKILPKGTRVYVAHIEGTPIEEMVEIKGVGDKKLRTYGERFLNVIQEWKNKRVKS